MIPINELRLFNIVGYNGTLFKVADINSPAPDRNERFNDKGPLSLFDGASFFSVSEEEAYPTPLSKEGVLEACGFEKEEWDDAHWWEKKEGVLKYYSADDGGVIVECNEIDICKLYNLHQLQNFIMAVTGKELEIDFSKIKP